MNHYLRLFIVIYTGGLALTSALMGVGSAIKGGRMAWSRSEFEFFGCWLLLWPISLPIVLYLLFWPWGPREVDLDEESIDL